MDGFEIKGLDEFIERLEALPRDAAAELRDGTAEATLVVEGEIKSRTPVGASGRGSYSKTLAQSITHAVEGDGLDTRGVVGTNVSYAPCVEEPQRPHWPPVQPIYEWVKYSKKFGTYSWRSGRRLGGARAIERENRQIAFLVARKISRVGTEGAHMFRDGLAAARDAVLDIWARAFGRAIARF